MARILVTGGAGYIGTHTCVELTAAGYEVVVLDNLCNSRATAIVRSSELAGTSIAFVQMDIRDHLSIRRLLRDRAIDAVVHLAGLKVVAESFRQPLDYYANNLAGSVTLLKAMADEGVRTLVFSSSAAVFGGSADAPIAEDAAREPASPYGRTKMFVELALRDLARSDPAWRIGILRYFNPVGAHPSGRIGECPLAAPQNLVPYLCMVAGGRLPYLRVFGDDYATADGTGIRDYIHVADVARAHVAAIKWLGAHPGAHTWNLGTGEGASVLDVIRAFESVSGRSIPFRVVERRAGDVAKCYADPGKAERELGWRAERALTEMCRDAWHWQSRNPDGYPS